MTGRGEPQRRPRLQRPHGAFFHVIYWEGGDPEGIQLPDRSDRARGLPHFCDRCKNVANPWKYRLDNFQACVRSCGKEGSCIRPEAAEIVNLSPKMAIRYDFYRFYNSLTHRALTERTVLGPAMSVHRGDMTPEECGVSTTVLSQEGEWEIWLAQYLRHVQQLSRENHSRAVALVLDRDGVELLMLDTAEGQGNVSKQAPIGRVVICLGGPSGMDEDVQARIEALLRSTLDSCVNIRLPGGLQHSNVVLADLFMANERWSLLPSVEQLIRLGSENYTKWREVAQQVLAEMQLASVSPDMGLQAMRGCISQLSFARGRGRSDTSRRTQLTERPNVWLKGPGNAGNHLPAQQSAQPTQWQPPDTTAYPSLSSKLQQAPRQNGTECSTIGSSEGHSFGSTLPNATSQAAPEAMVTVPGQNGSAVGADKAVGHLEPSGTHIPTTLLTTLAGPQNGVPNGLATVVIGSAVSAPSATSTVGVCPASEEATTAAVAFGDVPADQRETSPVAGEQAPTGSAVIETPAVMVETEKLDVPPAQEERIEIAGGQGLASSCQPPAQQEKAIEKPSTTPSRQRRAADHWADMKDDEPQATDDDLKACFVVANETQPEAEHPPPISDEPICEEPAPANEESASNAEEVASNPARTKKQWGKTDSERAEDDPPPLQIQEWPTLGGAGSKRGKRK